MIANALDDTWQDEFYDAVADWTESPALELTTERIDVDHNCTRIEGVMVVCNANFGDTGWVGINENELWDNVIYSSVSKMNEYYLRNADYGKNKTLVSALRVILHSHLSFNYSYSTPEVYHVS